RRLRMGRRPPPVCPLGLMPVSKRGLRTRAEYRASSIFRRQFRRLGLHRVRPGQLLGCLAHPDQLGGNTAAARVVPDGTSDDGVGADYGVVTDTDAAQEAGAVADPDVRPDHALPHVDALDADRALHLDDPVIEVDEHRPVGDHALLADPHAPVGRDRALLPEDRLGPDLHDALVAADLRPVADPREAPEPHRRTLRDLQLETPAEEDRPIGLPAPAGGGQEAPPQIAPEEAPVAE